MEEQQVLKEITEVVPALVVQEEKVPLIIKDAYWETIEKRVPRFCVICGGKLRVLASTLAEEESNSIEHIAGTCKDCKRVVEIFVKSPGYDRALTRTPTF